MDRCYSSGGTLELTPFFLFPLFDLVFKAYLDILGREPDTEGFDYYLSNLTDHKMTREAIIKALLDSDEGKAMKFSNVSLNHVS